MLLSTTDDDGRRWTTTDEDDASLLPQKTEVRDVGRRTLVDFPRREGGVETCVNHPSANREIVKCIHRIKSIGWKSQHLSFFTRAIVLHIRELIRSSEVLFTRSYDFCRLIVDKTYRSVFSTTVMLKVLRRVGPEHFNSGTKHTLILRCSGDINIRLCFVASFYPETTLKARKISECTLHQ